MIKTICKKFNLGLLLITPGAIKALEETEQDPLEFFERHQCGDWGEISEEDQKENELSLKNGFRLLSAYRTAHGKKIWIITEANRASTTVLLPEEY